MTAAPQKGEGSQPSHVASINIRWISEKGTELRRVSKDRKSSPGSSWFSRSKVRLEGQASSLAHGSHGKSMNSLYKSFPRQLEWLLGNKRALKRIAVLLG